MTTRLINIRSQDSLIYDHKTLINNTTGLINIHDQENSFYIDDHEKSFISIYDYENAYLYRII